MPALRSLLGQREARLAFAIWALVPAVFLFFALTLAVDPTAHLDRVRLGVAVLDAGISTPRGEVAVGPRLVDGLRAQLGAEVIPYPAEDQLRDAVLARDVAVGIVIPDGMTLSLQSGQPVALTVVRIDANDPFTNALTTNLGSQLATNLNAALPALLDGEPPASAAVSVAAENLAPTSDFRFPIVPAALLLPIWMASVAFAALLARAGDAARPAGGRTGTGVAELAFAVLGAGITAAVVTLSIAAFTWRWDIDLIGLFAFTWLGLTAIAWLILGTIRLLGFALGVLTAILALFIQQPVSGAAFPPTFAPDAVRWAEPLAPLRYLVEGVRNLLIGGSTTPDMAAALAVLAAAGAVLVGSGIARLWLMPGHRLDAAPVSQP